MTTEQMTIHKALAELKTLDNRISSAISDGTYVIANKHSNEKISGITLDAFRDRMKASYQRANDLINRRNAIKRAIVLSNATTKVNVNGVEYTVAEAIEMKNHGMEFKATLTNTMSLQYRRANDEFNRNTGENLERKAEQYILAVIQAQPKDNKMTVDSAAMKSMREQYIKDNAYDIIDPLNVAEIIQRTADEINAFNTEIDSALSVSNALTVITIEY